MSSENNIVENVGVDSGTIIICDLEFFNKFKSKHFDSRNSQIIKVDPGKYNIKWKIEKTWNGEIEGESELKIESGDLLISDPCYLIEDYREWDFLLDETDYLSCPPENTIVIDSMGGDGTYDIEILMEKISV